MHDLCPWIDWRTGVVALSSKVGFLFRSTDKIKADNPDLKAFESFDDLLNEIKKNL